MGQRVSREIDTPPDVVWSVVSDITRIGEWSPECHSCSWDPGQQPGPGATFTGHNRHGDKEWSNQSTIVGWEPAERIAWEVRLVGRARELLGDNPFSRWGFELEPIDGGTRLTATGIVRGHPWIRLDLNGETVFVHNSLYVVYEGSVFAAWDQAVEADTLLGYVRFRAQHPNSPFEQEAVAAIQSLQAAESTGFKALGGIHVVKRASNVYRKTSRQSAVLTEASAGDTFRATRQTSNGRWIELRLANGTVGYIRAGRVELYAGSVFEAWDQASDANTCLLYTSDAADE